MWQTRTTVGSREVLASGTLVVGHGEDSASVYANGIQYTFTFAPEEHAPSAQLFPISATAVGIRFVGNVGIGCTWQWDSFGMWQGTPISLAVELRQASAAYQGGPYTFILNYTFALGNPPLRAIGGGQ